MSTVPSQRTWVAGEVVTASELNANVRDAINFVITPPMAILRQTVAQTIAFNSWASITFDTEDLDRDNGHSTVTNTSRYTCQTQGYYLCSGMVAFASNATGRRLTHWTVNGTALNASRSESQTITVTSATDAVNAVTRPIFMNVGDYLELQGWQDTGGNLNTSASGEETSAMFVRWTST